MDLELTYYVFTYSVTNEAGEELLGVSGITIDLSDCEFTLHGKQVRTQQSPMMHSRPKGRYRVSRDALADVGSRAMRINRPAIGWSGPCSSSGQYPDSYVLLAKRWQTLRLTITLTEGQQWVRHSSKEVRISCSQDQRTFCHSGRVPGGSGRETIGLERIEAILS